MQFWGDGRFKFERMEFSEVFSYYNDDDIDSFTTPELTEDIITPSHTQQVLSPPISMPSNSLKQETSAFDWQQNESDAREDSFLRRMKQSPQKETDCLPLISDFRISQRKQKRPALLQTISKVKLRLNSLSSIDQALYKRANNRRVFKQRREMETSAVDEEEKVYFRFEEELYFNTEVW